MTLKKSSKFYAVYNFFHTFRYQSSFAELRGYIVDL